MHHDPSAQWRYRYPITSAEKRQWLVVSLAISTLIGATIFLSPTPLIVVLGVAMLCLFALRVVVYVAVRWANTGILQICPDCHAERPAGYTVCGFCGFTPQEDPSCIS